MNNQIMFKLLEEIRLQCRFAKFAYENLRLSLQAMDAEKTFFYVQAFLNQARNVSRLLWPARASSQERGERLRKELQVAPESPLNLRELGQHLDASDERLEDWIGAMQNPGYMDFNIMPQGSISAYQQDSFQRNLDPDTYKLIFRGESCDLRQMVDELHRLDSTARVWLATHNPW